MMHPQRTSIRLSALFLIAILISGCCSIHANAETVRLLSDDVEAFQTRMDVVETAQHSIDVACFWIDQDACARTLLKALRAAALRGVTVRLVVDDLHNEMSTLHQDELLAAGVQLRAFHRRGTGLRNLLHRMHEKYLVADQTRMVVGSRNIKNEYYRTENRRNAFIDIDVLVEGEFVRSTCDYFESLWSGAHVSPVVASAQVSHAVNAHSLCSNVDAPCVGQKHAGAALQAGSTFEVMPIALAFHHDNAGTKVRQGGVANGLYEVIRSARHSITIVTPYFLPANELGDILLHAVERGVRVQVLTNSLESTNKPLQHAGFLNATRQFTRRGLDIREFAGPETMHAKVFVVDHQVACITSFNFNRRSAMTDTEIALVIRNAQVASALEQQITPLLAASSPHIPAGVLGARFYRLGAIARNETPSPVPQRFPRTNKGDRFGALRLRALRVVTRAIPNQL